MKLKEGKQNWRPKERENQKKKNLQSVVLRVFGILKFVMLIKKINFEVECWWKTGTNMVQSQFDKNKSYQVPDVNVPGFRTDVFGGFESWKKYLI